ncbi:MAG: histidinol dehydrogenase [Microgenomates group bacterium]
MNVQRLKTMDKAEYRRIMMRSYGTNDEILPRVKKTMDEIRDKGDELILEKYRERFGNDIYKSIAVTKNEIRKAYENVDAKTIRALKQMIKNITKVQKAQLPRKKEKVVSSEKGITVWREWRAIDKVGLYIPGGKATYPSSVLMTAIPALIAGCREIVVCSPPRQDGFMPAATLVACDMLGITKIYKVGGVEAIAAMTYGTETIPAVYKIFGAGNSYVTAAKTIAQKLISIDMPAGPSEVFIIADETANPAFIASDLLADGEHGEDSACVLVTTSIDIAKRTIQEIVKQLVTLDTRERAEKSLSRYGLICLVDTLDEAVEFSNDYAPEHLELMTKDADVLVSRITNAGSVFVGNWTSKSSGDYATGANHVLPTGGMAKMYPPLGVDGFGKWMQIQKCTKSGLSKIKKTIETIASIEGLPAHKESVSIRFRS